MHKADPLMTIGPKPENHEPSADEVQRMTDLVKDAYRQTPAPARGTVKETAPHVPAAFINAIAEEGSKREAVKWLQTTWNERCQLERELSDKDAQIAALLEAMEWFRAGCDGDSFAVKMIRQRAEEILRRKG